ncbi:MAG: DUF1846 domain-containing protein [archaeon]
MKKGFDAEKYIFAQSLEIGKRVARFGRLYLEVGGKLCRDRHAARVLPGYRESSKVEILKELGNLGIVYCIRARDLVGRREVGLSGKSYEEKILGDLDDIARFKLGKVRIVITRFGGEIEAKKFGALLKKKYDVYFHDEIVGYGKNMAATLRGYEKNSYISIREKLIVVTGPAGGSGKMGFALSQIYAERKRAGEKRKAEGDAGFAKFESFPIWNLPMSHPVNLAYEAATADLGDFNMIDKDHLKAYEKRAVNYNRDVENFLILRKVLGERFPFGYRSVTDMGVNMMRIGIVDDLVCRRAVVAEIRRRFGKSEKGSIERERIRKILGKMEK